MDGQSMRVTDSRTVPPEVGAEVVTIDKKRLGVVREARGGHFQVSGRWGFSYWLSCNLIRKHEPGCVVLNISRSVLNGYKLKRLPLTGELFAGVGEGNFFRENQI